MRNAQHREALAGSERRVKDRVEGDLADARAGCIDVEFLRR